MNDAQVLADALGRLGSNTADLGRLRAMLADLGMPSNTTAAVMAAAEDGVPAALQNWDRSTPMAHLTSWLSDGLSERRALDRTMAAWAVGAWTYAMGIDTGGATPSTPAQRPVISPPVTREPPTVVASSNPQTPYPQAQTPYPQAQAPYPQAQTPYPQAQTPYPQAAQAAYPQAAYPQAAYPQAAYPEAAYPQAAHTPYPAYPQMYAHPRPVRFPVIGVSMAAVIVVLLGVVNAALEKPWFEFIADKVLDWPRPAISVATLVVDIVVWSTAAGVGAFSATAGTRFGRAIGAALVTSFFVGVVATIWGAALPGLSLSPRVSLLILGVFAGTLSPVVANAISGARFGWTTLIGIVLGVFGYAISTLISESAGLTFAEQLPLTLPMAVGLGLGTAIACAGPPRRQT